MDITQLSVTELKALAYDLLAQMEQAQKNLQVLNQELAKRSQEAAKVEAAPQVETTPAIEDEKVTSETKED